MPIRDCGDKHGADGYLCVLAPIFGSIARINEPLGCYRTHDSNFARGQNVRYRLERDARRYPFFFHWIRHFLTERGISVDTRPWYGEDSSFTWTRNTLALSDRLRSFVRPDEPFILVDDGRLGSDFVPLARPMRERNGEYAGPPANDGEAIVELERQRRAGATHIVFAPGSFWWLEYYEVFHQYLREHFVCLAQDEQLCAFELGHTRETAQTNEQ
jgi:hypothetical protein